MRNVEKAETYALLLTVHLDVGVYLLFGTPYCICFILNISASDSQGSVTWICDQYYQ